MSQRKTKNKPSYKLFVIVFALIMVFVIVSNLKPGEAILLPVTGNAGASFLETAGQSLICVFQDGQTAVWNWGDLPAQKANYSLQADRVCVLDDKRLAAVSQSGTKDLSVIQIATGKAVQTFPVGEADQDIRLRLSFDKQAVALIRQNPVGVGGKVLFEFLTVDLDSELPALPTVLTIQDDSEGLVDFSVGSEKILYAVGSRDKTGRIVAIDLDKRDILWDKLFVRTQEFCSVMVLPDGQSILAGNRNGILYKLNAETGEVIKPIQLLEEGETRPITNDYSVLNLAFSPDGTYYVATINPKAYILRTATDAIIHQLSPADKLVSRIALSPDNKFIATSDIRAGYPIKIWPMPE